MTTSVSPLSSSGALKNPRTVKATPKIPMSAWSAYRRVVVHDQGSIVLPKSRMMGSASERKPAEDSPLDRKLKQEIDEGLLAQQKHHINQIVTLHSPAEPIDPKAPMNPTSCNRVTKSMVPSREVSSSITQLTPNLVREIGSDEDQSLDSKAAGERIRSSDRFEGLDHSSHGSISNQSQLSSCVPTRNSSCEVERSLGLVTHVPRITKSVIGPSSELKGAVFEQLPEKKEHTGGAQTPLVSQKSIDIKQKEEYTSRHEDKRLMTSHMKQLSMDSGRTVTEPTHAKTVGQSEWPEDLSKNQSISEKGEAFRGVRILPRGDLTESPTDGEYLQPISLKSDVNPVMISPELDAKHSNHVTIVSSPGSSVTGSPPRKTPDFRNTPALGGSNVISSNRQNEAHRFPSRPNRVQTEGKREERFLLTLPYGSTKTIWLTRSELCSHIPVWNCELRYKLAGTAAPLGRNLSDYLERKKGEFELFTNQDSEHPKSKKQRSKQSPRVTLWNKKEFRKISGTSAPLKKNVERYLQEHPDYEVYSGQGERLDPSLQHLVQNRVPLWNKNTLRRTGFGSAGPLRKNLSKYLERHPHLEEYTGQDIVTQQPTQPNSSAVSVQNPVSVERPTSQNDDKPELKTMSQKPSRSLRPKQKILPRKRQLEIEFERFDLLDLVDDPSAPFYAEMTKALTRSWIDDSSDSEDWSVLPEFSSFVKNGNSSPRWFESYYEKERKKEEARIKDGVEEVGKTGERKASQTLSLGSVPEQILSVVSLRDGAIQSFEHITQQQATDSQTTGMDDFKSHFLV